MEPRTSSLPLKIFISHKMPSDTTLASDIGGKLALYGGTLIEVKHAGLFRYGDKWREKIQEYLKDVDWLIFLYTDQDEDWGFCLFECGFFRATMENNPSKKLITLARHPHQINDALKEFNAVPMTEEAVFKLLDEIYRKEPWNISKNLNDEVLKNTSKSITSYFTGFERVEANFDISPSVVIEFTFSDITKQELKNGRMPAETIIGGVKDWQKLFDREIDTGSWLWADLTSDWPFKDVYEYLISKMMYDAIEKRAPKGVMLRGLNSTEVHRLTLRRYEKLAGSKYKFYFTAALLDLPFSLSIQRAKEQQTLLYHLVSLSWYFRRRVVDELYRKILEEKSSATQKKANVKHIYDDISYELMSIDSQAIIRGVSSPLTTREALGDSPEVNLMLDKLEDWYRLRSQLFEDMMSGSDGLNKVSETLYIMATINLEFYKLAAKAYAEAAMHLDPPLHYKKIT
ncbi:hypothetical protein ABZT49_02690 [Methylobacterium sp. EM32]|uniref:hypothetical protein n=1 Tax=Methylobacterium sp. EM32 TaxID=3163481 RepID=UPI0033AD1BFA